MAGQAKLDELKSASVEKQKEFVIGKTAGSEVVSDNGDVIAAEGQEITAADADAADGAGKLVKLMVAAGAGAGAATASAEAAKRGINGEEGARQTIGRRLHHSVRDPGGSIIGAQGQIVTEGVAERAKEHNLEVELLSAAGVDDAQSGAAARAAAQRPPR